MSNPYEPPKPDDSPRRRSFLLTPQFRFWAGLAIVVGTMGLVVVFMTLQMQVHLEVFGYGIAATLVIGVLTMLSSATRIAGSGKPPAPDPPPMQSPTFSVEVVDVSHFMAIPDPIRRRGGDYSMSRLNALIALALGIAILAAGFGAMSKGFIAPFVLLIGALSMSIGLLNLICPDRLKETQIFEKLTLAFFAIGVVALLVAVGLFALYRMGFRLDDL